MKKNQKYNDDESVAGNLYKKLPRIDDYQNNGVECERKYQKCKIF